LAGLARREGREVAGRGRIPAAVPDRLVSAVKKKKGRGGEGADRRGPVVSAAGKKKREGGERWAGAGMSWAAWAERSRAGFVFFLFPFSNFIFKSFSSQIQFKLFQTFLKNFIDFLETTQATKNHASQKMMHIHLLSLSLLNYL
jgi:hypothetical protein